MRWGRAMRGAWLEWLAVAVVLGMTGMAAGGAAAQDRSQYTLLNPTPDKLLREMTTDRPDITESSFTVDAGHVQFEATVFGFARSGRDSTGAVTDAYEVGTTNVRIGLTSNFEAGFVWQPYGSAHTHGGIAGGMRQSGIGGLELRAKLNLWGNDSFDKVGSAMALLPFLALPTDRHNGISPEFAEGGLIVPYTLKLADKLQLATNTGVVWTRGEASAGFHAEYLASASVGVEWSEKLGTYYEVAGRFHMDDPRGDAVVVGTGLTYRLSKNVQLDAGVNIGVTPAADRLNPFVGLAVRF
jgi:hypothetical protein